MKSLLLRAWAGLVFLVALLGLIIFGCAGTTAYPAGWAYLAAFGLSVIVITAYFLKRNPELVDRRTKVGVTAETRPEQKIIQGFSSLFFIALLAVPGLDHRFGWSHVPVALVILADLGVLAAFAGVFWVMHVNSFLSSTIEVAQGQQVISTGPYAVVRHPMYAFAFGLLVCTPLALGSWWGLLPVLGLMATIMLRLLDEEQYLAKDLPGYADYCQKVKWRLLPGVW